MKDSFLVAISSEILKFCNQWNLFRRGEMKKKSKGQTLVEYALIIFLVLVSCAGIYAVVNKALHKQWAVYSKIIAAPLP